VPITETRKFDGTDSITLWIDPLISITSLSLSGTPLNSTDYRLLPYNRHWDNGPEAVSHAGRSEPGTLIRRGNRKKKRWRGAKGNRAALEGGPSDGAPD
jgi:hypothetical protein